MISLILGTAQWRGSYGLASGDACKSPFADSLGLIRKSEELGLLALDTAPSYGEAEIMIGNSGSSIAIHTKFDPSVSPRDSLSNSLRHLCRQSVEIAYFHNPRVCLEEESLIDRAREMVGIETQCLGSSVYEVDEFCAAVSDSRIQVVQAPLNPLDRRFCGQELITAMESGTRVIFRSVFLQGVLLADSDKLPTEVQHLRPYVEEFQQISRKYAVSRLGLVFNWLGTIGPSIDVVIGVENGVQLSQVVSAMNEECEKDAVSRVWEMKVPSWAEADPRRWKP